ncbi:hypothetical protein AVEN_105354-1 [Araneus ventricosus]|uniref:Uncharacterized protein n=1 Tax=Araneus ventricosus TaxID=182803 RepID=A0A4Y2IFE4_ARAVE|nr:hypothetical protein AVEN_13271-1 [Araneus ventricosus]GBM76364.1 hypothetical protein AVEN_105354-1 [Araneus ventricosus]
MTGIVVGTTLSLECLDCSAVNFLHKFQPTCTLPNLPPMEMQPLLNTTGGMHPFPDPWLMKELDYDYSLTNDDVLKS